MKQTVLSRQLGNRLHDEGGISIDVLHIVETANNTDQAKGS